jgi:hypothetical protein
VNAPSPVVPEVKALFCPNCGGSITLRSASQSLTAVCSFCNSILDARTPGLNILQQFDAKLKFTPIIPLGTRGNWTEPGKPAVAYEVIGYQVRGITVEGIQYTWEEYLLFNPYHGYRYLTHYRGHWNFVRTIQAMPEASVVKGRPGARLGGEVFAHFQTARASTIFVMGEFPWQIRVGETVEARDYILPPYMLSAEETADEVVWSRGTYTPGRDIWQAFRLPGTPPAPVDIFANQPSPHSGSPGSIWRIFILLIVALMVAAIFIAIQGRREVAFEQTYSYDRANRGEQSFVTPTFELKGHTSNVEVEIETNLQNDWTWFAFALINENTGDAYNFSKEVSYYYGSDSDGPWTEGSRSATAKMPNVPPGRYFLRVEPEGDEDNVSPFRSTMPVQYRLRVRRDVPGFGWFVLVFLLLLVPPIFRSIRWFSFENRRWAESDYGALVASTGDSDEDDE